jgi:hypothetical protein
LVHSSNDKYTTTAPLLLILVLAATEMTLLGTKKQNQKYKAPKKMTTRRVDREMKVLAAIERERERERVSSREIL